jgi:hypothetical protein
MIERKRRLQYVIGLVCLFIAFLRLCVRQEAQPLGMDSSSSTTLKPNVHVVAANQTQPLGNSSSATPEPEPVNRKNLPLHFKKSKSGCWRQCEHRRNKIVFDYYAGGLGDRSVTFQGLANLAGYLCAVLVLPRPAFLLDRKHNEGRDMDISTTWNDFFNVTFRQDGAPSIVDLVNPNNVSERPDPVEIYGGEDYKQWYLITSKNGNSDVVVVDEFLQLEDYSFRQPPDATAGFIWIVQRSYYGMRRSLSKELVLSSSPKRRVNASRELPPLEMLPLSPIGCSYQQSVAPLYIQTLARNMLEHIRQQAGPSVIGAFHIRRGDAKSQCNTRLQRMKSYLQCSFNGTESRNITLLFRSDERDQKYRSAIQTMVHDLGHTFIDLDALIKTFLKEAVKIDGGAELRLSNYYVYALSQELITKVSFELKQHRKANCEDCNKLAGRADLWNK